MLEDFESTLPEPQRLTIEKDLKGKCVKASPGNIRLGYTLRGEWHWTAAAVQRYSQEQRDMARSFAEDE